MPVLCHLIWSWKQKSTTACTQHAHMTVLSKPFRLSAQSAGQADKVLAVGSSNAPERFSYVCIKSRMRKNGRGKEASLKRGRFMWGGALIRVKMFPQGASSEWETIPELPRLQPLIVDVSRISSVLLLGLNGGAGAVKATVPFMCPSTGSTSSLMFQLQLWFMPSSQTKRHFSALCEASGQKLFLKLKYSLQHFAGWR